MSPAAARSHLDSARFHLLKAMAELDSRDLRPAASETATAVTAVDDALAELGTVAYRADLKALFAQGPQAVRDYFDEDFPQEEAA